MWLRRLVGIMIVLAFVVMNTLTVYGLVAPKKVTKPAIDSSMLAAAVPPPVITFSAEPTSIAAGSSSALKWTTSGVSKCVASSTVPGSLWTGEKTQDGAESTGRISKEGNFIYTLTCTNEGGSTKLDATITVGKATAPVKAIVSTSTPSTTGATYCGGRSPCYGPKDVASHGSAGNCWGWNGDKVINISNFDKAYHQAKSGVSSIEISAICGKDLAPALGGSASAGGQTRNHLTATKVNASANTNPYIVGYFDASK